MEPWFDGNAHGWIFGTVLGCLGGLFGSVVGALAPRGRAKRLVYGVWGLCVGYSAVLAVAGTAAKIAGQPYGVWYGLGLPGFAGLIIFGALFRVIGRGYTAAEERRMQSEDM